LRWNSRNKLASSRSGAFSKQPVKNAKDLLAISKKLKANEKILLRVYSQGRSGYVALEAK
jgi:hypothetical protein